MENPLEITVLYGREEFQVTLKYDKAHDKPVRYNDLVNQVRSKAGLHAETGPIVLLTRTDKGLVPVHEANYAAILTKTGNLIVDVDGAIIESIVKHFEKLYVINPSVRPNIFGMDSLIAAFNEELSAIIEYVRRDPSLSDPPPPPPHIDGLTNTEAEMYLGSYFNYYVMSKVEATKILNGGFFGVAGKKQQTNDPYAIYNNDPYLDSALFNAVRGGSVEKFERERSRFKMTSLLLSPDEIRACFVRKHAEWAPETIWSTGMKKFINNTYFGIPESDEERKLYFTTKDMGFMTYECVSDIYQAALSIINQTRDGDRLVVFGNSPFFIGRALKYILSQTHTTNRVLIEFPFSGAPNGKRSMSMVNPKDIVTPLRLEHLRKRLRGAGLSSHNKNLLEHDTYFIDVVGMASGFVYVAEEILRDFHGAGLDSPNLMLITMNRLDINSGNSHNRIAKENPDEQRHTVLYFPTVDNTRFVTMSKEAYVKCHMRLDMLTDDGMRGYPEYNASYWQEEYDYLLVPRYSNAMQILLDYFDYNVQTLYLISRRDRATSLSCQSCGEGTNLQIETGEPFGIYCDKCCQGKVG